MYAAVSVQKKCFTERQILIPSPKKLFDTLYSSQIPARCCIQSLSKSGPYHYIIFFFFGEHLYSGKVHNTVGDRS